MRAHVSQLALGLTLIASFLAAACTPAAPPSPTAPPAKPAAEAPAKPAAEAPAKPAATTAPAKPAPTTAAAPKALTQLSVGAVNFSSMYLPVFVARSLGFFKDEGLEVSPVATQSSSQGVQALEGGSIQINASSPDNSVLSAMQGGSAVIIGSQVEGAPYSLMVTPDIKAIQDLKGKRLGASALKTGEVVFLKTLLAKSGLTPNDYELIVAGPSRQRVAAMLNKSLAGTLMPPPDSYQLEAQGIKILADTDAVGKFAFVTLSVKRDWGKAHQDEVVRYLRAHLRALAFVNDAKNRSAAAKVLADELKVDQPLAEKTFDFYLRTHMWAEKGALNEAGMQAALDSMVEQEVIKEKPASLDKFVDLSYLKLAQGSQ